MRGVRHSNSATVSPSSGGASLNFLIAFLLSQTVPVARLKGTPINPYFLARQLLSPSRAPHCLAFRVATWPHFFTSCYGPFIRMLSIQTCIFSDFGEAYLEPTTAASPANTRATVCNISACTNIPSRAA
ncbi:hypothetical protein TRVL_06000 [Trypanosoma vivax]|nr:hypothetical protein TRVL_06000 [Trypanosoma vivax]